MNQEAWQGILSHLREQGAPELVFSPPLVLGEFTLIRAATVTCTMGQGRLGAAAFLRVTPCAILVIKDGEVSVVPVHPTPGGAEKLADLLSRWREGRGTDETGPA